MELKMGKLWVLKLKMRIVGSFLTKYITRWKLAPKTSYKAKHVYVLY